MADYLNDELFRTARKGGYEKEDVDRQLEKMRSSAAMEKDMMQEQIDAKNKEIASLKETIVGQQEEIDDLQKKYRSYQENYDTIGEVILDSRIQAKKLVDEAQEERERILSETEARANQRAEEIRAEATAGAQAEKEAIEQEIAQKQAQYEQICAKIAALLEDLNAAQSRFGESVAAVQSISEGNPPPEPAEAALEEPAEDEPEEAFDLDDTHEIDFQSFSGDE